ncbi:protease-4 [Modicisalibacter xianhensis]|uniref:Protease-4 n=1 Tax=Modicisalibacter xianhensis TaxID=442341 RepID=A0A4R8FW68_9GAMM|nr:signal peptide peptidase SppA [Halomonas xianhensis]TDX26821.1 protease-4 [Halomonas xianhensis]
MASPGTDEKSPQGTHDEQLRLLQWETFDKWMDNVATERRRSRRWKIFFRCVFFVFLFASLANTIYFWHFSLAEDDEPPVHHLGVVDVEGVIDTEQPANATRINEGLRRAMENELTDAVILRINSPGGSPVQSQRIYNEIRYLREQNPDKPILAWIEDVGASGAYYVASAASKIYAAPASLVGSIGVIHSGFGFQNVLDELNVERRLFTAGQNKAFLDPFVDVKPEQREFWQSVLNTTHAQFIQDVKQGRGDRLVETEELFSGLVWNGEQAKGLGLVDSIATLEELSRELMGDITLRNYTPRLPLFERLGKGLGPVVQQLFGGYETSSPVQFRWQ